MNADCNHIRFTHRLGIAAEPACHLAPRAAWTTSTTNDTTSHAALSVMPTSLVGTPSATSFAAAALPPRVRTSDSP
jgi:hypothetical protein